LQIAKWVYKKNQKSKGGFVPVGFYRPLFGLYNSALRREIRQRREQKSFALPHRSRGLVSVGFVGFHFFFS
jgi:hypothetical protein